MLDHGVDSRLLTGEGMHFRLASEADRQLWKLQRSPRVTWRSPARFGSLRARDINRLPVDVVNLHWVTDGLLTVEEIGRITKPIVWTMHDMWPFTGTEHYVPTDATGTHSSRWVDGYAATNRPTDESGVDLDRWTWRRKQRAWTTAPHLVPVSTWLQRLAKASALASEWPSTVIPNVMPIDQFVPNDRADARRSLGLPPSSPLIAFTASAGIGDKRKGWTHLRAALARVRERFPDVGVVVIGPHSPADDPGTTVAVHWQGEVRDDALMATLIAAVDVVAVPSEMDNLPMTACEAQSCGRPVVAFHVGGLPDIVEHQRTGYLARPYETDDLATGLIEAIEDSAHEGRWGVAARGSAVDRWSPTRVVERYLELYMDVLS